MSFCYLFSTWITDCTPSSSSILLFCHIRMKCYSWVKFSTATFSKARRQESVQFLFSSKNNCGEWNANVFSLLFLILPQVTIKWVYFLLLSFLSSCLRKDKKSGHTSFLSSWNWSVYAFTLLHAQFRVQGHQKWCYFNWISNTFK